MKRIKDSKAQLEVWRWKEEAWKEVAHLDLGEAMRRRLMDSVRTADALQTGRHRVKHAGS
jgi:hypothetical protein